MKRANISKIKAELSQYLRYVKQGEEVVILDRDKPIAKIVAVNDGSSLNIVAAKADLKNLLREADQRTFDQKLDILDVLLEDREEGSP